jgi:hypothetical protein
VHRSNGFVQVIVFLNHHDGFGCITIYRNVVILSTGGAETNNYACNIHKVAHVEHSDLAYHQDKYYSTVRMSSQG